MNKHEQGKSKKFFHWKILGVLLCLPLFMGQERCGASAKGFFSDDPAPSMEGVWDVTYDDQVDVEIDLGGGAVYYGVIADDGGEVAFTHDGEPVSLDLDCSKPWIVCPSEVWTETVEFLQPRFAARPHQVQMLVQDQECLNPRMPEESEGECSSNPDVNLPCDVEICDPEDTITSTKSTVASISNPVPPDPEFGDRPGYTIGIALSGGMVIPAANCLLIGTSFADADIVYTGQYEPDPEGPTMFATDLTDGVITIIFSGACFWAHYSESEIAGALLGASVKITTGFTASIR